MRAIARGVGGGGGQSAGIAATGSSYEAFGARMQIRPVLSVLFCGGPRRLSKRPTGDAQPRRRSRLGPGYGALRVVASSGDWVEVVRGPGCVKNGPSLHARWPCEKCLSRYSAGPPFSSFLSPRATLQRSNQFQMMGDGRLLRFHGEEFHGHRPCRGQAPLRSPFDAPVFGIPCTIDRGASGAYLVLPDACRREFLGFRIFTRMSANVQLRCRLVPRPVPLAFDPRVGV